MALVYKLKYTYKAAVITQHDAHITIPTLVAAVEISLNCNLQLLM